MAKEKAEEKVEVKAEAKREMCGIVMPIAECDGCDPKHWLQVRGIIKKAAEIAGFDADIVSNGTKGDIIQQRILQNLLDNPIVVVDMSGRNANVMFELGLRLSIAKPTILIKDFETPFSFDTGLIEHLEYPRSLNHPMIETFIKDLSAKITRLTSKNNNYVPFIKALGPYKVVEQDVKEVPQMEIMMDAINDLRSMINNQTAFPRMKSKQAFFEGRKKAIKQFLHIVVSPENFSKISTLQPDILNIIEIITLNNEKYEVKIQSEISNEWTLHCFSMCQIVYETV
jgi:hypothetical protein